MKGTFGSSVSITLAGESHGKGIVAILSGMAPGILVDCDYIANELKRRRPKGVFSTSRQEADRFEILSGVYKEYTTGTPITVFIPNEDVKSEDYKGFECIARPGHADYTAHVKYCGFEDPLGGGHFSGRVTAGIVAAGAICRLALDKKGIKIGTHVFECVGIKDSHFENIYEDIEKLQSNFEFPTLNFDSSEKMISAVLEALKTQDSVGGISETAVCGLPAGIGEPYFESIESKLSQILFSIPAIKGVEFGDGFGFAKMHGSEARDELYYDENGEIHTKDNHNGGINGGISNGEPIIFRCAVKPTPSISIAQDSIDLLTKQNKKLTVTGRHDPCIVHRICAVIDAVVAIGLCDLLAQHYGTNYFID